jgi:hypothetical protein
MREWRASLVEVENMMGAASCRVLLVGTIMVDDDERKASILMNRIANNHVTVMDLLTCRSRKFTYRRIVAKKEKKEKKKKGKTRKQNKYKSTTQRRRGGKKRESHSNATSFTGRGVSCPKTNAFSCCFPLVCLRVYSQSCLPNQFPVFF